MLGESRFLTIFVRNHWRIKGFIFQVGAKMSKTSNWKSVIEVVNNRLLSWKARHLSIGGRLVLIKAVLENLPIYYLSLYKAPKAVIEKIEAIMRRFLWAGSCNDK